MREETRENLIDEGIWMRGVFMLFFLVAYNLAEALVVLVTLFQFITVLFTGKVNEAALRLGNNLSIFVYEAFQYLTFNSDIRPFPFSPWPDVDSSATSWREDRGTVETVSEEVDDDNNPDVEPPGR